MVKADASSVEVISLELMTLDKAVLTTVCVPSRGVAYNELEDVESVKLLVETKFWVLRRPEKPLVSMHSFNQTVFPRLAVDKASCCSLT